MKKNILLYSVILLLLIAGRYFFSQGSTPVTEISDEFVAEVSVVSDPTVMSPVPVKIAVIGDFGDPSPSPADAVANLVNSWNVDYIVTTGDNNYPRGLLADFPSHTTDRYLNHFTAQRFLPTLGNHDWGYEGSNSYTAENLPSSQYFYYLPGNKRYYSYLTGNGLVEIFVLDTDVREPDGNTIDSTQGVWFQNQVSLSKAPYKFVFTHEPPYSSCDGKDSVATRWPFKNLGITAVFSGHCHLYERLEVEGLTYIINGAGGGGQTDRFNGYNADSKAQYNDAKGAVLISADSSRVSIVFYNISGEIIDTIYIDSGSQQAYR